MEEQRRMIDPNTHIITCEDPGKIISVLNALSPQLPPEARRRMHDMKRDYFLAYGMEGLHERTNGRTLAQVLSEYTGAEAADLERTGEVGGTRFRLYSAPKPREDKR
jgi:hypothetical protein